MMSENLKIWKEVCETPKNWTKKVEIGKRKYTTISAYRQIERATALWGPFGGRWGVREEKFNFVDNKIVLI